MELPGFLLALASPVLLYSLAITVVPRDSEGVASWKEHFWHVRGRFFYLFASWIAAVSLANWLVLGQPFLHPVRLGQSLFFALFLGGALSDRIWLHRLIAVVTVLAAVLFITSTFVQPAPLG